MKYLAMLRNFLLLAALILCISACTDPPASGENDRSDAGETPKDCTDYCQPGERTCLDDQMSVECVVNDHGCYDFANPARCDDDLRCSNGTCVSGEPDCNNECAPGDPARCNVNGLRETCADHDQTGCLTYGGATACEAENRCDSRSGECVEQQCEDSCIEGETVCDLHRISTCRKDADGCFNFVSATECGTGKTCEVDACVSVQTCTSECNNNDLTCSLDGEPRICGDWHDTGCFVFSEPFECSPNEVCREGDCVSATQCQDECLVGETLCIGNKIATCADYNGDGCVEFDAPIDCPTPGATCQLTSTKSECKASPHSGAVVINEIFYDPLGHDLRSPTGEKCETADESCSSPTFIELTGPPGLLIADYKVEMINGSNGKVYNTATLPQDARIDGRGYAVLAMDKPDTFLSYAAPFSTNIYYILESYAPNEDALHNTRGSVVLYDAKGDEADAVGYGSFSAAQLEHFRGQGQPAPGTSSGRSLGRIPGRASTHNNAADFITFYPTPGMPNQDLIINEVYVNQPGGNDGTETFVELAAPILGWEDLSLDRYVLRAVAGHNGKDYIYTGTTPGIVLDGKKLNDTDSTDGYVLLCNKNARQPLHSLCSVHYEGSPFYTGPDNFILEYEQHKIDAVGYGTFTPSDTFLGERNSVPYAFTDSGRSLSRGQHSDATLTLDTNDNAVDFRLTSPTPGTDNARN